MNNSIIIKSNLLFTKHKKLLQKEDFYWRDLPSQQKNIYIILAYRLNKILTFITTYFEIDSKNFKLKLDYFNEPFKFRVRLTILKDDVIVFSQSISERSDISNFVIGKRNKSFN